MSCYPRRRGSSLAVNETEWNKESPFGHCPACGSVGIEEGPSSECEVALFRCSDESCFTLIFVEGREFRKIATAWSERKPDWQRAKETEGQTSWSWEHFSPEFCTAHDLV